MHYLSTNYLSSDNASSNNASSTPHVDFREAVLNGLAPDGGLYVPATIARHNVKTWAARTSLHASELAQQMLLDYVAPCLDASELRDICDKTFSFEFPLVQLEENLWSLELFHGPTLAFKDVGARFLAECLSRFSQDRETVVLVATSGDTGSAVANGFLDVAGVRTVILYPKGKVSPLQEKQFASLGGNTTALAIDGTFDDCQALVKAAFSDPTLRSEIALSSANSINIARWLPQSVYFAHAALRLDPERPLVISVPSGNFGNITAGIFATRTGLEVARWIAALNANDVVERFLRTGTFVPQASKPTLANAMDVGNPSNIARLKHLFGHNFEALINEVDARSFADDAIANAIADVHKRYDYFLDPHGATGWLALQATRDAIGWPEGTQMVFAETAHPAKFGEAITSRTGLQPEMPARLAAFLKRTVQAESLSSDYAAFSTFLRDRFA